MARVYNGVKPPKCRLLSAIFLNDSKPTATVGGCKPILQVANTFCFQSSLQNVYPRSFVISIFTNHAFNFFMVAISHDYIEAL